MGDIVKLQFDNDTKQAIKELTASVKGLNKTLMEIRLLMKEERRDRQEQKIEIKLPKL